MRKSYVVMNDNLAYDEISPEEITVTIDNKDESQPDLIIGFGRHDDAEDADDIIYTIIAETYDERIRYGHFTDDIEILYDTYYGEISIILGTTYYDNDTDRYRSKKTTYSLNLNEYDNDDI